MACCRRQKMTNDVMSDVTNSRRFGFNNVVDSKAIFVRLMRQFRAERIVL